MTQPQKFFLGPGLVDKLRDTVRRVDAMPLQTKGGSIPTVIESIPRPAAGGFKIATFTGAWATNTSKTVTFKYQTVTPNTVSAVNLFFPVPTGSGSRDCALAKEGTAWFLINVPLRTAGVSGTLDSSCNVVVTVTTAGTTILQIVES